MDTLKELTYPGPHPQRLTESHGKVVYLHHEDEVYFTAVKSGGPSTINWAEQIIQKICEVEGIDWRTYTFYDIQTVWGYPYGRELTDFCIDRLILEDIGNRPSVVHWDNVVRTTGWNPFAKPRQEDLHDAVPVWVIEAFQGFILT